MVNDAQGVIQQTPRVVLILSVCKLVIFAYIAIYPRDIVRSLRGILKRFFHLSHSMNNHASS